MLTIATKDFDGAMKKCMRFIIKKATLPVLANVKVEYKNSLCTMSATTLQDYICVNVPGKSDQDVAFVFTDTVAINKAIKFFGDAISFELEENKVIARSGNKSVKQEFIAAEEFPAMVWPEQLTDTVSALVNGLDFDKIYRKCKHAISTEETRPMLTGMMFGKDGIYTTNGICAVMMINKFIAAKFTIPETAVRNFNLVDDGILYVGKKDSTPFYFFGDKNVAISGWMLDGNVPDINQVIPSRDRTHETYGVSRKEMIDALQFAINMGATDKVKFANNKISGGTDENIVNVDLPGQFGLIEFSFNPNLVLGALNTQFETNVVTFEVWAHNSAFVITGSPDDGVFVCMPMHLG